MRITFLCSTLLAIFVLLISSVGESKEDETNQPKALASNQVLMRNKLEHMNLILEGITLDQFDQVEKSAEMLQNISLATGWHIVDQTPQYKRLSKNFQEQATDLRRHAKERNVEAATLDLVRMNITCTHCHQHMREEAKRYK